MSLPSLKLQLVTFIRSMYEEGIVNRQFLHLDANKQSNDAVIRAITFYYLSSKQLLPSLTDKIEQPTVDFEQVNDLARDFFAKSCDIGAESVRCACLELIRASQKKDKDACYEALYCVKNRFSYLRRKFESVVKMERNIIYIEDSL